MIFYPVNIITFSLSLQDLLCFSPSFHSPCSFFLIIVVFSSFFAYITILFFGPFQFISPFFSPCLFFRTYPLFPIHFSLPLLQLSAPSYPGVQTTWDPPRAFLAPPTPVPSGSVFHTYRTEILYSRGFSKTASGATPRPS